MRTMKSFPVVAIGLVALLTCVSEAATPVARILRSSGEATIAAPDGKTRPARTYGTLYQSETLQLSPEAMVELVFRKQGRRATIKSEKQPGKWQVEQSELKPKEGVLYKEPDKSLQPMIVAGVDSLPDIAPGGVTVLRGPAPKGPIARLRPVDGGAVLTTRPTFRWPEIKGATQYHLVVLDQYNRRHWETDAKEPLAKTPEQVALTPGREYSWEVSAPSLQGAKVIYRGAFSVRDPEDAADIDALANADDPALLALAATGYEELGLLPKAIKIYEKLHKEQPRDPVFPAALSDLYERAGMRDRAAKARDTAVKLGFQFEKPKPSAR